MRCKKCGKEISDNAIFCEYCGEKIDNYNTDLHDDPTPEQKEIMTDSDAKRKSDEDLIVKIILGILSACMPLAGLILFLVLKQSRPEVSKVCGICALCSFVFYVVVILLFGSIFGSIFSVIFNGFY